MVSDTERTPQKRLCFSLPSLHLKLQTLKLFPVMFLRCRMDSTFSAGLLCTLKTLFSSRFGFSNFDFPIRPWCGPISIRFPSSRKIVSVTSFRKRSSWIQQQGMIILGGNLSNAATMLMTQRLWQFLFKKFSNNRRQYFRYIYAGNILLHKDRG